MSPISRTPAKKKAQQFIKLLKKEQVDYGYLREIFKHIRKTMKLELPTGVPKNAPYVPTEEEVNKFYQAVWKSKNMKYAVMIRTMLYTGVKLSELINMKIDDVDLDNCQIEIRHKDPRKNRIVPFPRAFAELLATHIENARKDKAKHLFESSWRRHYSDKGIRKILSKYTEEAGIKHSISPTRLRHFLLLWMKKNGIGDALVQAYSGIQRHYSLDKYSQLANQDLQHVYQNKMKDFPI